MKKQTLLISGLLAVSLSACGATTGGLAKSMAKQAAVNTVSSQAAPTTSAVVMQSPTDYSHMDCAALATEMTQTDAIIVASTATIAGSGGSNVAGQAVAAGASQAALHSGAAGALAKVPFGGLFARKAMNAVADSGRKKVAKAQADLQSANLRKASLSGVYAGKNCAS